MEMQIESRTLINCIDYGYVINVQTVLKINISWFCFLIKHFKSLLKSIILNYESK